ncbi:hypothetical protein [Corynebacterium sp. AOP12-C2-36]|uniref:hypothetical protein n=1 Tax=Corynebacterium sp. AOP12-C2-36 TaxID=3457723 RepID=UPI004033A08F
MILAATATKPSVVALMSGKWAVDTPSGRTSYHSWNDAMRAASTAATQLRQLVKADPAWMIQRRLQALAAAGWGLEWVAKHTGLRVNEVSALSLGEVTTISPTTCRRIRETYSWVMSHTQGGMIRDCGPTALAKENNWAPPAEWDDIDDPQEEHRPRVPLTDELHLKLLLVVASQGSDRAAARTLDVTSSMVTDLKSRRSISASPVVDSRIRQLYAGIDRAERAKLARSTAERRRRRQQRAASAA